MAHANLIGQVLDDKYLIERQLGKGGMGAVYLATHLGTGRPVALKVITPQFMADGEFVERFRREAKAAGRLRHPNVVNVTDFGFAPLGGDRLAYLVMEYLGGCTLSEILAEETHLDINWVIDILEQTCSAIDEAHQQGIIHRDLKPDNIWLEPNRRGGYTVKVLDFGLAKLGDALLPEEEGAAGRGHQSSPLHRTPVERADGRTQAIDRQTTQPGGVDFSRLRRDGRPRTALKSIRP
jgi:serine/threonine protein kinase